MIEKYDEKNYSIFFDENFLRIYRFEPVYGKFLSFPDQLDSAQLDTLEEIAAAQISHNKNTFASRI